MTQAIIETRALRRVFKSRKGDVEAVAGIDLQVQPAEIFGFLGPNGAGKTTTLRMLATLLPLTLAPDWLRKLAAANPLSYAVDAARAVFNNHMSDPSVAKGVVIMVLLSLVAIWLGARAFGRAVA